MDRVTDVERLIREAVEAAEYGLGRDGCPFCGGITAHDDDCIAVVFGAKKEASDVSGPPSNA